MGERAAHALRRFDFAYGHDGVPKLLEYNADTPTGLLETAVQWHWLEDVFGSGALPKGEDRPFGATFYHRNWHIEPFEARDGCQLYLPRMQGWGGNLVTLMPGRTVGLRIANAWTPPEGFQSAVGQARVAERLTSFCRP